jgi:glycosyltransferase involved in cell wall biosynthesis
MRLGKGAVTAAWRRADAIIAISNEVRRWLVEDLCVPTERVRVIYYGIEPEGFRVPPAGRRTKGNVIGSIGRLEERKGHADLIAAMPMVRARVPHATLLIAGNDPWGHRKALERLRMELGVADQVQLVGFQADVAGFLHSVDVFAFASRAEGFGQVVIEAMACGKPVVASRVAPLTEIVVEGVTGLTAEPRNPEAFASALSALLTDSSRAQWMGERGRERVTERFLAARMGRETIELYESVLARSGQRRTEAVSERGN